MFGKLVPVPSGAVIPERDIGKRPILNCINLGVDFGGLRAVDDFNLTIGRTEIAGLIGPNGAGKTTVFNLLTKVYQPTHGTILLDGQDTHNMTTAQVNRMLTSVQLEAYKAALVSHGITVDRKAVLHLKKAGKPQVHIADKASGAEAWMTFGALMTVYGHIQKYKKG